MTGVRFWLISHFVLWMKKDFQVVARTHEVVCRFIAIKIANVFK